ncbi:hypothetical protein BC938DRAFT_480985, partial [Jimgerdemannia flammicorona]
MGFTPLAEYGHSSLLIKNTIYIPGGDHTTKTTVSSLFALDVSQPWPSIKPPWVDRTSDAGIVTTPISAFYAMFPSADGDSFYVWGGGNDDRKALIQNGFAQYNTVTRTWSLPSSIVNMPSQRRFVRAACTSSGVAYMWSGISDHNGQMVIIGGYYNAQVGTKVTNTFVSMTDIPMF